jgi:hypothetical protein
MGRRQFLVRGLVVTGAAAAAMKAARGAADRRAAERFYEQSPGRIGPIGIGGGFIEAPFVFHRSDSVQTFHAASFEAVRNALPSTALHPVRLPDGRAVVLVASMQYGDITTRSVDGIAALPYGEVMVAILVTPRPAPPFLPLVAPSATGLSAGGFVLHLPVTTRAARDVGRLVWGYPRFVADMEFDDSIAERRVHVAEGGHDILTLTAHPSGRPSITHESPVLYSVLGNELIESTVPTYGIRQLRWGRRGGRLELGDHQVADELRTLEIAPEPFVTALTVAERLAMRVGRPIGPARPCLGYIGEDRDLGRYVVRYPNTAPIDRYAPVA